MQRGPRAVKSTEAALGCTPPPLCCFMQCWEVCTCNTVVLSELRGSSSPRLTNCLSLRLLLNVSSQHICIVLCSRVLLKCPLAFVLRRSLLIFSSDLCSLVFSDLILFSTSCSTEASLLKRSVIFVILESATQVGFYYYKSTGAELNTTRVEKY